MSLSNDTKRRMIIALTSQSAGNNAIGAIGLYGGCQLGAAATVAESTGDFVAIPDSGGAAGTYRLIFADPSMNQRVKSIDWFEVASFTPRSPSTAETDQARVTGYNYDTSLNRWYVTVQVALLSDNSVDATPPNGFVIGIRMAVSFVQAANSL